VQQVVLEEEELDLVTLDHMVVVQEIHHQHHHHKGILEVLEILETILVAAAEVRLLLVHTELLLLVVLVEMEQHLLSLEHQ
jgi:hypothetical protein